ncbi:hypothetical protein PAPYR_10539 [Paratrimastix pyriformis]|uniref:Uncharacterized protein n=1 Tax=Paratrimastix pyriformis TaxID=342808 RepID=A0ABQ8U5Q3_9EUKA|nr:hypothetical protein PAPYR_10539 [Paratrimastix pyriformis]
MATPPGPVFRAGLAPISALHRGDLSADGQKAVPSRGVSFLVSKRDNRQAGLFDTGAQELRAGTILPEGLKWKGSAKSGHFMICPIREMPKAEFARYLSQIPLYPSACPHFQPLGWRITPPEMLDAMELEEAICADALEFYERQAAADCHLLDFPSNLEMDGWLLANYYTLLRQGKIKMEDITLTPALRLLFDSLTAYSRYARNLCFHFSELKEDVPASSIGSRLALICSLADDVRGKLVAEDQSLRTTEGPIQIPPVLDRDSVPSLLSAKDVMGFAIVYSGVDDLSAQMLAPPGFVKLTDMPMLAGFFNVQNCNPRTAREVARLELLRFKACIAAIPDGHAVLVPLISYKDLGLPLGLPPCVPMLDAAHLLAQLAPDRLAPDRLAPDRLAPDRQ